MKCEIRLGACFRSKCVHQRICQEKHPGNYKVVIVVQKTYLVNAPDEQEALNIVASNVKPLPDKIELVTTKVAKL